jgi:hypothetical protein
MRRLHKFIEDLHFKHSYDIVTKETIMYMEFEIETYITEYYPKIKRMNYITLEADQYLSNITVLISPEFEKQLEIHYPERLI